MGSFVCWSDWHFVDLVFELGAWCIWTWVYSGTELNPSPQSVFVKRQIPLHSLNISGCFQLPITLEKIYRPFPQSLWCLVAQEKMESRKMSQFRKYKSFFFLSFFLFFGGERRGWGSWLKAARSGISWNSPWFPSYLAHRHPCWSIFKAIAKERMADQLVIEAMNLRKVAVDFTNIL